MASSPGGSRLGTRFGPYELQSLIGEGGMGEVYRAYDTVKDRMVAIKLLRAEMAVDANFQERFRRESRVAARLQEPHVIPVHDFGEIDGVLYIDMRLVDGVSLKEELRTNGPLAPRRAAAIIAQVAAALDAAHADGLVHRDIKPENVLLTSDDFAYLVDFGIVHTGGDASVTKTGLVIGSCAYMAAERFGDEKVGPPADVYSLACLLYECLTGRPPFETADVRQLMSAHMFAPPPRPSIMRRGIPRVFDDVIARGMAKKPIDRFGSAGELARAATAAGAEAPAVPIAPPVPPSTVTPPSPTPPPSPPSTPPPSPPSTPPPPSTRQFSAIYPNPAGTGYTPYPPPVARPDQAPRKPRLGRSSVVLIAATIALFGVAAVLAAVLVSGNDDNSAAQNPLTVPAPTNVPGETSEPSTTSSSPSETTTTPSTTTTTTSPSATASEIPGVSGTDGQGFVGHWARCDEGNSPAAVVRTAQSLAVVCESSPGSFYYRGERLSDGATIQLANATPAGGGFDVTNPADGARYEVRPDQLTILSNGGVDSRERALEYGSR